MENIYKITHFDREKQPKSLNIALNAAALNDRGYPKPGDVVLSIFTKEKTLGFSMSTGDISDLISVLIDIRDELIKGLVTLRRENAGD